MNWPTSQDYNEAVQDPANFTDPALKGGEVVLNALGLPVPRSGNFADVYQFKGGDGKMWALKCFTRKVPGLRERYAKIDEHLNKAKLPFTVGFKFFEQGIQVKGERFPLLKMEWVEGFTLNEFVAQNLAKPHYLHALMQMWTKLTARLRDANMAHADLQHGNVLLVPGATPQKLGLKLIDYDGMWVPALSEFHSGEVGHPNFQHPLRLKEKLYNGDVDRFPHLVIAAGLRATLIGGKPIWERFDNEDNLLFREADLRDPGNSRVFKALWELNDPVLRTLVGHLTLSVKQPLRKTPWLDDVLLEEGGPKLTSEQEKQVCTILGVAAPSAAAAPPSSKVEQEFNVFQFFDDDEPSPAAKEPGRRSPPAVKKPKSRTPAKSSKAPLFIAGGVAAAVLVVGGIVAAVALSGGKKQPTNEVVQNKEEVPKPPPEHVPGKPKNDPKDPGKGNIVPPVAIGDVVKAREDLREALTNTKWNWGEAILELKADGKTYQRNWDEGFRLTTRWEAVDRRTAVLYVESGRKQNLFAVLEFSEDLSQFGGHDFGALGQMPPKKRVGPLSRPAAEVDPTPPDSKNDLRQHLAGSRWQWARSQSLVLKDDGYADLPGIAGQPPLLVKWEPIDRRTVMLAVEQGRNEDRLALLQFAEDLSEFTGFNFSNAERFSSHSRLDKGAPPASPKSGAIGVAADRRGGRDYLFIRKDDPTLYMTQNGSPRKAREVGRHAAPIRVVAVTPDGGKAITGSEDGEVRIWALSELGKVAAGEPAGEKKPLAEFKKITALGGHYSIDVFEDRVVIQDVDGNKSESMSIGKPGFPVKGAFANNLRSKEGLAGRLGQAVTNEVPVFMGELIAQVFEGGVQLYSRALNKSWFGTHRKRQPSPMSPAPAAKPLKTKLSEPKKISGFQREYEYTLYQEGMVIRDVEAKKDETIYAGPPVSEKDGDFSGDFAFDRLTRIYGDPVSVPTKVFDGTLRIVLCRRGFYINQIGTSRNYNFSSGKEQIGEPKPAKADEPRRADFVWLDDELPAGAKPQFPPYPDDTPWEFIGKKDGPVYSGEKAIRLVAPSFQQHTAVEATPGLLVGEGDTLFAHVYLDPKNPPEQIMIQLHTTNWIHLAYWGADKVRVGNKDQRSVGALPAAGKWIRLEFKVEEVGIKPGMVINGIALTQCGGTSYWDAIGLNTKTAQESVPGRGPKVDAPRVLKEHTGAIVACAVSQDGNRAVSIGQDKLLCEWTLTDGKLVGKFPVPEARAVAFLPDNKTVVIGTESESAGVWDLAKKERIKELPGHQAPVRAACASEDLKKLWTGDEGGTIRAWKLPGFEEAGSLSLDKEPVAALTISPDDKTLACAGANGTVRFFNPTTGATTGNHQAKTNGFALAFVNDGKDVILARVPDPQVIHLSRQGPPPSQTSKAFTLLHETDPITEVSGRIGFSPDGKYLLNGMREAVVVLETATGKEVGRIKTGVQFRDAILGPNKHLYFATADDKFQLWDWGTGEMLKEVDLRASKQPGIFKIHLTADPTRLLLLSSSPSVVSWDVAGWKAAERLTPLGRDACIRSAMFPDGKQVVFQAVGPGGMKFVVWDIAKSQTVLTLEPVETRAGLSLDVSPNGKWIVGLGTEDGKNAVWDAKTGKLVPLVSLQGRGLRGDFTAGGDYFVRTELNGQRALVDMQKDTVIEPFQPRNHAMTLAVSSATNVMATVDNDRRIRLWRIEIDGKAAAVVPKTDPKSPTPVPVVEKSGFLKDSAPLSDTIVGCTFSTDGKKIYASTQDGEVHVLDATTLEATSKFTASKARISHMAFVPKTTVATGGLSPERLYLLDENRQVHVWDPEKAAKVKDIALDKATTKLDSIDLFAATATDTFLLAFDRDRSNSTAWDLRRGTAAVPPILNRPIFAGFTRTVAFTPDGRIGAAQAQGKLLVWNVGPGTDIRILDVQFPSRWLGLIPDASVVAMATEGRLQFWNYSTGKEVKNLDGPHGRFETFLAAVPLKGHVMVTAGSDRTLRAWDAKTGGDAGKWQMELPPAGVSVSQDGKYAAVWHGAPNKVSLWAIGASTKDKDK